MAEPGKGFTNSEAVIFLTIVGVLIGVLNLLGLTGDDWFKYDFIRYETQISGIITKSDEDGGTTLLRIDSNIVLVKDGKWPHSTLPTGFGRTRLKGSQIRKDANSYEINVVFPDGAASVFTFNPVSEDYKPKQ